MEEISSDHSQTDQETAENISEFIFQGFRDYLQDFNAITQRAFLRFQERDWLGIQADSRERLNLYKRRVKELALSVKEKLGEQAGQLSVWKQIRQFYLQSIAQYAAFELAETFYNSVCRKVFRFTGIQPEIMFVTEYYSQKEFHAQEPIYRTYDPRSSLRQTIRQIIEDFQFVPPFQDLDRDTNYIRNYVEERIAEPQHLKESARIEVIKSLFYRNKAAYIVGRIYFRNEILPFVLPILHKEDGLCVDTLVTEPDDISIIFSFTRSYFMVEVEVPSELVNFIKTLMPLKSTGELYNSIGFNKHGKTEFYRDFLEHMEQSNDQFVIAPGIKGMVMSVFTLPSYNIVFKLIKDKFDPPKTVSKQVVMEKYELVKEHDRVGRMADTHEFEYFAFDKNRFSPELLEELWQVAPSILEEKGDQLIIKHLYTERKMIPLNIYLENASPEEAEEAVNEYGNAIRQLAAANIFPGDMLLKNFGVTRHRRVVFYDYDEISLLTECNFRRIPEARSYEDEMSSEPWYTVGPNDVFPEEFRGFLIGRADVRQIFFKNHSYLFEVDFWKEMQEKQIKGEVLDVFPYRRYKRFRSE